MDAREKFNSVMDFECMNNLKVEMGYWVGTVKKWIKKGLPKIDEIPGTILD